MFDKGDTMAHSTKLTSAAFCFIDWIVLLGMLFCEFVLVLSNLIGIAWWAQVETLEPNATYWFGPFLSCERLRTQLNLFLNEISEEAPGSINHQLIKRYCKEPYTLLESEEEDEASIQINI